MPKSASSNQLSSIQVISEQTLPACKVYFTVSVDAVSMTTLMSKQICKEHWPLIEFELTRTSINQSLGLSYVETFFINKTEVVIQKVFPNSLAASSSNNITLRPYDIIHSLNNVRVTSIKQLNKLLQKAGTTTSKLKFAIQRPCILLNKTILTSFGFAGVSSSSSSSTNLPKKQDFSEVLTVDTTLATSPSMAQLSSSGQSVPQEILLTPNDQSNSATVLSSQTNSLVNTASSVPAVINNSTSSSIVSNTRQRLGRLEQKLKNSFGTINNSNIYIRFFSFLISSNVI